MGQSKWLVNSFPTLSKNLFIWRLNWKWVQKSTAARERVRWSCLHRPPSFSVIQTFQSHTEGKKVTLLIQIHESCCCIGCYHMYAAVHWRLMMLMSPQMSRFCAATRGESRPRVWGGGEADDFHPAAGPAGGRRCAHKALSLHVWKPVNANIKTKVFNQVKGLYSTWVRKIYVRSFFKLFW